MTVRYCLIALTLVAVLSDSLLHPFFPQYFYMVFGIDDAQLVSRYIASCSFTVIASFPFWAWLSKRFSVLTLLIWTQLGTCVFSLLSSAATDVNLFWGLSLAAMIFKASYLLIYPYALSEEEKTGHLGTISLLAFVVYFGSVLSSIVSGAVLEYLSPRWLFILMATGDVLQICLCLWWRRIDGRKSMLPPAPIEDAAVELPPARKAPQPLMRIGALMLVLYFSAYISEPFFSTYWEALDAEENRVLSGLVYAVPALAAVAGVWLNARATARAPNQRALLRDSLLGIVGLGLQATAIPWLILLGRIVYGWALFQVMVRLDHVVFHGANKEEYASVFARMNLFQGGGVLLASLSASQVLAFYNPSALFLVAALGFTSGTLALMLTRFANDETDDSQLSIRTAEGDI
jgi:DHA1 family multidrug resistance protein-like MFS transporter